MKVHFYQTPSEPNRLYKTLNNEVVMDNVSIKDEQSILTPTLLIGNAGLINTNYMWIEDLHRYYFIDEIRSIRNGLWEVKGRVDVLMTYQEYILNLTCVIERQEGYANYYLNDTEFKVYQNQRVQTKRFPAGFTKNLELLLLVAGGGVNG